MKISFSKLIDHHGKTDNYVYLLVALLLLVITPPLMGTMSLHLFNYNLNGLFLNVIFSLVILSAIYTTTRHKRTLIIGFLLGCVAFIMFWVQAQNHDNGHVHSSQTVVSLMFFAYIGYQLAQSLLKSESVTLNTIIGATVGYLLIGLMGGQCFALIDKLVDNAFGGLPIQSDYDYYYFSYITLTTIGYGDIVPVAPITKSITVLIGLVGQIYLTCVIALLIGKFLSNNESGATQ